MMYMAGAEVSQAQTQGHGYTIENRETLVIMAVTVLYS